MSAYYAFDGHGFDEQKAGVALTTLLRDRNLGRVWLILDGEVPVGYIVICFSYSLEWLGRDAFVDEFYLLPEYRGHGWGRKTMAFVEDACPVAQRQSASSGSRPAECSGAAGVSQAGLQGSREHVLVEMDRAGFFQAAGTKRALTRHEIVPVIVLVPRPVRRSMLLLFFLRSCSEIGKNRQSRRTRNEGDSHASMDHSNFMFLDADACCQLCPGAGRVFCRDC